MADPILVTIPQETVNDESVRILSWKVESNSRVDKDQLVCEVETSKALMEIHAPAAGVIEYDCAAGSEVPVGSVICKIVTESRGAENGKPFAATQQAEKADQGRWEQPLPTEITVDEGRARLTPLARAVAAELGIDTASFPAGRLVRRDDVLRRAGKLPPAGGRSVQSSPASTKRETPRSSSDAENVPVAGVPVEWADLPRMKLLEGRILRAGRDSCIQSSVTSACRAPYLRERLSKLGLPEVGLDALVVFEAARLLLKYPALNALHDRGRIGRYKEINVGWAIDGGEGLVVPVVKQADQKDLREVAAVMNRHVEAYVSNALTPSDFLGGTFTVTNLTRDGVSFFQPLISQSQSAILGIGSELDANGGETFYLTLAFDHQVAEGRVASRFVSELCSRLEAHATPAAVSDLGSNGPSPVLVCTVCERSVLKLRELGAFLVKSELPPGSVCSICLAGY